MSRALNRTVLSWSMMIAIAVVVALARHAGWGTERGAARRTASRTSISSHPETLPSGTDRANVLMERAEDAGFGTTGPAARASDPMSANRLRGTPGVPIFTRDARIVATLRRSPEEVDRLVRKVLEQGTSSLEAGRLLSLLAVAGTDDCQRGILSVVQAGKADIERRRQAIRYLATVAEPIREVDVVLKGMIDEFGPLASEARTVWAAVGGHVRDVDGARFDAAAERVQDWLESAAGDADLQAALGAVGHLGPSEVPIQVIDATRSVNPEVRLAAVRAMRRMGSPAADEAIARAMREDPCESTRLRALEILVHRQRQANRDPHPAVAHAARSDPSARVRTRATELLASRGARERD
ncbi:MAG: HEAT repeat domain-containing protein [Planctomycetota bacterium]|jgi:hypothetical protein